MTVMELECKKLCLHRCLMALTLSIITQFILLTVFLLFVNFHVFHLINWITETFSLMWSFHTWLNILPLISGVILYCILLGMSQLNVKHYYATRFQWLLGTTIRKVSFLVVHIAVGFLTAYLYARYLHADYRTLEYKCYDIDCINAKYVFLMGAGIFASCCHFFKENLRSDPEVEFPFIQLPRLVRIRYLLYSTLFKSLRKSFMPSLCYALVFWLIGDMVNQRLALFFESEADTSLSSLFSLATSLRLLFYSWILSAQILSSMHLSQEFFSILLSEQLDFPVEKSIIVAEGQKEVTLVEALAMSKIPVIQTLAAFNFSNISARSAYEKRKIVFALSIIGGHPHNWNNLYAQCLSMINAFMEELAESVKNISTMKSTELFCQTNKPITAEVAEKILLRQYNEAYGIRRIAKESPLPAFVVPEPPNAENQTVPMMLQQIGEKVDKIFQQFKQAMNKAFYTIPGIYYMFGEPEGAKTAFLLSNSQRIAWIVSGLAGITAASLKEDKYGVLQRSLPEIIRTLIKLRAELEKLNNVYLNGKKLDYNLIALKGTVKRSLYRIIGEFSCYLRDIFDDPVEVQSLQGFVNYTE